ncbi:carboxypeptidase-like regulatory domain-containing protein [Spirosoma pomorum]
MLRLFCFPCLWLLVSIAPVCARLRIQGFIFDKKNNQPLAYVNIGIPGKAVGMLSNPDGSFAMQLADRYKNDSLLISHLGYSPQKIALLDLNYLMTRIDMTPSVIQLPTVHVLSKRKQKLFELGNKLANNSFIITDTLQAGSAMALLIENKYPQFHPKLAPPFIVQKASVQIAGSTFSSYKLRIRLMDYDSLTELPGRDLLERSVVIHSRRQQGGWLEVDLSDFDLRIDQPRFFLVVEWIMDELDQRWLVDQYRQFASTNPKLVKVDTTVVEGRRIPYTHWVGYQQGTSISTSTLPYSVKNYRCYYRLTSQDSWKRSAHILSARITVSQ